MGERPHMHAYMHITLCPLGESFFCLFINHNFAYAQNLVIAVQQTGITIAATLQNRAEE